MPNIRYVKPLSARGYDDSGDVQQQQEKREGVAQKAFSPPAALTSCPSLGRREDQRRPATFPEGPGDCRLQCSAPRLSSAVSNSPQGGADMKINFTRKVRFSREITIGLSVLLVLTVILIVVAARRFTRHVEAADAAFAEERAAAPREERRDKSAEEHHAASSSPAPLTFSGASREWEKEKLADGKSKEYHEAKTEHPAEVGFVVAESAKVPCPCHVRFRQARTARAGQTRPQSRRAPDADRLGGRRPLRRASRRAAAGPARCSRSPAKRSPW